MRGIMSAMVLAALLSGCGNNGTENTSTPETVTVTEPATSTTKPTGPTQSGQSFLDEIHTYAKVPAGESDADVLRDGLRACGAFAQGKSAADLAIAAATDASGGNFLKASTWSTDLSVAAVRWICPNRTDAINTRAAQRAWNARD